MIRRLFLVGHVLIRWGRIRGDELFAMKLGGGEPDVIDGLAEMRGSAVRGVGCEEHLGRVHTPQFGGEEGVNPGVGGAVEIPSPYHGEMGGREDGRSDRLCLGELGGLELRTH